MILIPSSFQMAAVFKKHRFSCFKSPAIQMAFHLRTCYHIVHANDEPSTILTNRINRFSAQWLGLCQKQPDQLALRQTAPKRVRRNRGQIRRFRELDGKISNTLHL